MGGGEADDEGYRLANKHSDLSFIDLLGINFINIYDYGTRHNEGNKSVPRDNRPIPQGQS